MASALANTARRAAVGSHRLQLHLHLQHRRPLHMTHPAPSPSSWLGADLKQSRYLPQTLADLQATCRLRKLSTTGSSTELADRLTNDDLARRSRNYTTTTSTSSKRPSNSPPSTLQTPHRTFNTTRALKAPKDASTIDFTFLPDMPALHQNPGIPTPTWAASAQQSSIDVQVPFLPPNPLEPATAASARAARPPLPEVASVFFKPEISTAAALSTHLHGAPSAMSDVDVVDNVPSAVATASSAATQKVVAATAETVGGMRRVWEGLVEDVFGVAAAVGKDGPVAVAAKAKD